MWTTREERPMKSVEEVKAAEEHCAILWQWLDLIVAKVEEEGEEADPNFRKIADARDAIRTAVLKSSYLGRRLYGGEAHRTEPCPVHRGRWSGLPLGQSPSCGCDLTGWLAEPDDRDVLTYDGSFELDFLLEGEEVGSAGDGSGACVIFGKGGSVRVEIGETVVRRYDGSLSVRPVDNTAA